MCFEVGDDGASEDRGRHGSKSRRSCATRAIAVILNRGEHRSSPERDLAKLQSVLARMINKAGAVAGLPHIHPHQLRHTLATQAKMSRVAPDASFAKICERRLPALHHTVSTAHNGRKRRHIRA
jgi:integrase